MHYWMVESMSDPANSPTAFWTNGGPGCSGLIGFMTEQGPFRPNADKTLTLNEYAWNQKVNMVFIESPAGVGFSYSDEKSDMSTGDEQTALDNYNLIQGYFARFPEYSNNSMYITSESYGGHYMPTLAKRIVDENTAGTNPHLNFKGFAVGNPYTDVYSGTPAMIDTYWGHQLIAKPIYSDYKKNCIDAASPNRILCLQLESQIMAGVGNLNAYALDYPICTSKDKLEKSGHAQRTWLMNHIFGSAFNSDERKKMGIKGADQYEPCEDNWANAYLNDKAVKEAIHVKDSIRWNECSYTLDYDMSDSKVSTAPIYNYLIDGKYGLDILVYSGDDDSVCGTIGTQSWIWDLGYKVASEWETYMLDGQTVGFGSKWTDTKLGFLTIHGAGHEVPTYKPAVALDMWHKYLAGEFTNK